MDIVEFAEKELGIELLDYQKELLRKIASLPKGSRVCTARQVGRKQALDIYDKWKKFNEKE